MPNCQNLYLMQAGCRINFPGGGGGGVAGLTENKANSANLAELELGWSLAMRGGGTKFPQISQVHESA